MSNRTAVTDCRSLSCQERKVHLLGPFAIKHDPFREHDALSSGMALVQPAESDGHPLKVGILVPEDERWLLAGSRHLVVELIAADLPTAQDALA